MPHPNFPRRQSGFTLIEIAIVLVIIGLLLGGILKGQELITSARIRNVANDFQSMTGCHQLRIRIAIARCLEMIPSAASTLDGHSAADNQRQWRRRQSALTQRDRDCTTPSVPATVTAVLGGTCVYAGLVEGATTTRNRHCESAPMQHQA